MVLLPVRKVRVIGPHFPSGSIARGKSIIFFVSSSCIMSSPLIVCPSVV